MEQATLEPVEISNRPDSDSRLVVDSQFHSFVTFGFLLPFALVAVSICGALVLPPRVVRLSQSGDFSAAPVTESLTQLSPWVGTLLISLQLPNATRPSVIFKSTLSLAATRQAANVLNFELPIKRFLAFANGSYELPLFATDSLNFDTIKVTLSEIKCPGCGRWILNWDLEAPLSSMVTAVARLLCATLLIPHLVGDLIRFTRETSFERKLTSIFVFFTLLEIDPFYVAQLFIPSPYCQICHLVLRDLYFGGLGFYAIRLFAYFTPNEGELLNSGFPGAIAIVILVGLLIQDFVFANPRICRLLPKERVPAFGRLTASHCYVVSLLCAIVVWRAVQVGRQVPDSSLLRYRYYTISCITFLLVLIGWIGLEAFTDKIENATVFLTNAVAAAFALFAEYIHSESGEFAYGEHPAEGEAGLTTEEEVQLGADEDLDQISAQAKTSESAV
jgi:hypothetical protein